MAQEGAFFWRNTPKRPKFLWFFDYVTSLSYLLLIVHMRLWTFYLAVGMMVAFSILAHFGFTISLLVRRLSFLLGGKSRPSRAWWHWDRLDSNNR